MKRPLQVPPDTLRRQATASDPRNSVWVSANAGSGKTHVLAQRVVRLLLGGADPSRILCLTYTRAAAANMSNRVFETLSAWTMLPDAKLTKKIEELEGEPPDAKKRARARKLFTQALETPGGLKVQTIHAFCESVLHQFPLEANIAAHFTMLDPRMEDALFAEARRDMITGAAGDGRPELAEAFATVLERGGEFGLDQLLGEIVSKRDRLRHFIDAVRFGVNSGDRPFEPLFEEFGFASHETAETIAASVWPLPDFPPDLLTEIDRTCLAVGAARARDSLVAPAILAFGEPDAVNRFNKLQSAFLSSKGEPYKPDWLFGKKLLAAMPDLPDRYSVAAKAIISAADDLARYRMVEGTQAALILADWLIARYEQLKAGRGFLDFNDLISRTVRLLARQDAGPWVQYKLDKGIDHILLDEAQDTSPDQWNVVKFLAAEFFAGHGAREGAERTIFAVGDEKQSIYSFQGASPESFAVSGMEFKSAVQAAGRNFESVNLKLSFRSTDDVLRAVDRVFADPDARRGLSHDPVIEHEAIRTGAPGYVELWPSLGAQTITEPEDWREAVDHATAPAVLLAERVAATIDRWLKARDIIEGSGKRITPGDIMILVRKRDRFVHALSRALKNRDIAVAGADRLRLPSHIAIQDLIALGRYLVQPEDDLSLAAVLKSPIFGLDEEELYTIAADRGARQSLHTSLRERAADNRKLHETVALLDRWATEAAFKPVFEFYAGVLGRDGVRKKLITRLGHEAGEILDEFLAFCLAEERSGQHGLEAFLVTLETAGPEIKREMDQKRDEVRILTVHASKGLEAPIVFLVDSGSASVIDQHMPRLTPFPMQGEFKGMQGYLWRSAAEVKNSFSDGLLAGLKDRADDEYRRLLYVGMTRAEDRLVICGYHGIRVQGPRTWHSIVTRALSEAAESKTLPHPVSTDAADIVQRFRVTGDRPLLSEDAKAAPPAVRVPLPRQLFEALPAEDDLPKPLSPSGASLLIDDAVAPTVSTLSPVLDHDDAPNFAIQRGLAIHKMLQFLPNLEPAARAAAAARYLDLTAASWSPADRGAAWTGVNAILADPVYSPLFAEGSRAEVAIMGHLTIRGCERVVSGTVDRLAVTEREVLVVDYKTNRPPPATLADVPQAYILQLALYAELLRPLYPARNIRAALLFTEAPRLIEVPESVLRESLARLTQA
ncbi:MAG: double-strand break repair helicase AddA [Rhizobiaceae bacterium]